MPKQTRGEPLVTSPAFLSPKNLGFVSAPQIKFRSQIQPDGLCETCQQNSVSILPSSMKGRSHRPLPSVPLEDWGDGQWTVDCSCGVNFDDGEEMVSCDECGVWVHTRCSRYVRGEVSFACHKCKASAKRSRSVIPSASNNFVHDTEETEVAQLLVELPTKTDHPPPAPPAPYRPPFRLWAHVPMEERVHVQGVPGGDPSLFRGLSSKIFSPELWKCTGYIPKNFNFKYKEFPCWEEEERDKASLGADALFSLSKEIVQAAPARTFEKILSADGSRKERGKLLLDSRPFVCVKKERNKLRVLGSHSSKGRKEEPGEEKEFNNRKRSRVELDKASADVKEKAGSVPMFDSIKEDLEDGGLQIEESVVPDSKSGHNKEDCLHKHSGKDPHEGMENGSKTKHMLVFKTSRRRLSDEALRPKFSLETPVKVEKFDRPDGKISCKLNTAPACHVESKIATKGFTKHEDVVFKEPKNGSFVPTAVNGGAVNDSEKMKGGVYSIGNHPDASDIISSSVLCSSSTKKVELNVKVEATDDQVLENSSFPSIISTGDKYGMDDLTQSQPKSMDISSIVPEESIKTMSMQPEEQKLQITQKDSELSQRFKECINIASNESMILHEVIDSAGSLRKCRDSIESDHASRTYCSSATKSNGVNPSHSNPPVQKVVGLGEEFLNSTALYGSKSPLSSTQNSAASTVSCSPAGKAVSVVKQQRVKPITSIDTTAMTTSMPTEENEQGILQQPGKVHPIGAELLGSSSLQAGKHSHFSASKKCSFDSKEPLSGPSCQISAETPTTSSGTAEATRPLVHSPASQLKSTSLGSTPKIDKTVQSNTQQSPKFPSHSLVMQASTLSNVTNLSDEELALLLHQELNSSPRVPRVPRVRLATNTHFATPSTTSTLSKRPHSVGKDQVSFFRRKHKENSFNDGSRHSRDAVSESRRSGRHSPEAKLDESSVFSDGFTKRGKGSSRCDTMASSKSNARGTSTEGANSLAGSSEQNGKRASLRTPPSNVDGDGTLAGLSLPGLIDEIMSKGKCSTYEELCDSVRPYWRSLRKPNGERYAYFSHSQAVLDCLRNRSEWAHLIDRGPKTNASKRRRKLDSETPATELEHEKGDNSQREDFPKGKRNVRKRRLLEQRLEHAKEATSPSAQGTLSDDDPAALSHSSNGGTECNASDDTGPEACSSSSGDSD